MGVGEGVFWRARVQEPSYGGWLSECTPDAISQRRECPRTRAYPAIAFGVESVSHCTPPPITAVPPLLSCAPQSELGGPRSVVQPQERMRHWGWLPAPRGAQGTLWRCKRPFEFPILRKDTRMPVLDQQVSAIPDELKTYPQWICWIAYHGDTLPHDPCQRDRADLREPNTWRTFDGLLLPSRSTHTMGLDLSSVRRVPISGSPWAMPITLRPKL